MSGRRNSAPPSNVGPALVGALLLLGLTVPVKGQSVTVTGHVALTNPTHRAKRHDTSPVVVWLSPMEPSLRAQTLPRDPAGHRFRLVQKGKRFEPHLLVVPLGSVVEFPNLDPFFHNVFSLYEGQPFDLGLYEAGSTRQVHFDRPGVCYIFCNIHPEMSAVVIVLDTPYYATANARGDLAIPDVPFGRYLVRLWTERALQETLRSLSREVTINGEYRSLGVLRISEAADLLLPHKNLYDRDYDPPTPTNALYGPQ